MVGRPPSIAATAELVVPRSIPTTCTTKSHSKTTFRRLLVALPMRSAVHGRAGGEQRESGGNTPYRHERSLERGWPGPYAQEHAQKCSRWPCGRGYPGCGSWLLSMLVYYGMVQLPSMHFAHCYSTTVPNRAAAGVFNVDWSQWSVPDAWLPCVRRRGARRFQVLSRRFGTASLPESGLLLQHSQNTTICCMLLRM